jgi:hypothetical protein
VLKTYPLSVHEDYLIKYKQKWINDVNVFLTRVYSGKIPSSIAQKNRLKQKSDDNNIDADAAEVLPQLLQH